MPDSIASCLNKFERKWISAHSGKVIRKDSSLIIQSGKYKKSFHNLSSLANTESIDSVVFYIFRNIHFQHWIVIEKITYLGTYFLLIDARNGKQWTLDAVPVFSPSGKRFTIASGQHHVPFSPELIRIYTLENTGIREELFHELKALESSEGIRWVGEGVIELSKYNFERVSLGEKPKYKKMLFTLQGNQWLITGK